MSSTCESKNCGRRSGKIIVRVPEPRACDKKKGPSRAAQDKRCCYIWQSGPSRRPGKNWRESTSSIT